jgi:hypothetical protein
MNFGFFGYQEKDNARMQSQIIHRSSSSPNLQKYEILFLPPPGIVA